MNVDFIVQSPLYIHLRTNKLFNNKMQWNNNNIKNLDGFLLQRAAKIFSRATKINFCKIILLVMASKMKINLLNGRETCRIKFFSCPNFLKLHDCPCKEFLDDFSGKFQ